MSNLNQHYINMKKVTLVMGSVALTAALLAYACKSPAPAPESTVISADSLVKRGNYLVSTMGCDDCHTNKVMGPNGPELDLNNRLAGHLANVPIGPIDKSILDKGWVLFSMTQTATFGPWGVSYAANLTSSEHGIGNWSEEQFLTAIRHGKFKGMKEGRPLMPPMPWQGLANLNDQDLKAIFAYLKSTKPVDNIVPAWVPINEVK